MNQDFQAQTKKDSSIKYRIGNKYLRGTFKTKKSYEYVDIVTISYIWSANIKLIHLKNKGILNDGV